MPGRTKKFLLKILLEKSNQFVWDVALEDCFIFNIKNRRQQHGNFNKLKKATLILF